jgi:glucose/arabinose dehydrogenase
VFAPVGPRLRGIVTFLAIGSANALAAEDVLWTNLANATATGSSLQHSGCNGCLGGATSSQTIPAGDGYAEFTVSEVNTGRTAGLSHGNTDATPADIDFAIHLNGVGNAEVRENGAYKWDVTYVSGDVFRIAVTGGQVSYRRNGVVFYSSTNAAVYPLLMDASLGGVGATISSAVLSGTGGGGGGGATPPVRSNGQPAGALPAGTTSTTLRLSTNEQATCRYATSSGVPYTSMAAAFTSAADGLAHSVALSGLGDGNSYAYYVKCQDTLGHANTDDFTISFSVGSASGLPAGFEESLLAGGLAGPTSMAFAPDGRLFVAEQSGRVRIIKQGALLTTPFLTVSVNSSFEQGLLGVAVDPDFAANGRVYVYHTFLSTGRDRISRFTARSDNPDVADPASQVVILDDILQSVGYHDGGALHFGLDGKLYVAVGDGGTSSNSQSLVTLGGKMLRIDPASFPNVVPPDNPFVGTAGARGEIWALGLRNPFTFGVDHTTGKIHINDVGQNNWEEINLGAAGANYGWPACEGTCSNPSFVDPVHAYSHGGGQASVTGGAFYRGNQFPGEYSASYFFADYVNGFIRRLTTAGTAVDFAPSANSPVDLDVGPDGSLYYLSIFDGAVYRIRYVGTGNGNPTAVASAAPTSGPAPLQVAFSGAGSTDPDGDVLTYSWNFGDGSPLEEGVDVSHAYSGHGSFSAVLTVDDQNGGTSSAAITVIVGTPPVGVITQPSESTRYSAGDTILFEGTATDAEDGELPDTAVSWTMRLHHLEHFHSFLGPIGGVRSGSFAIPRTGETDANVWYRIYLTVADSSGSTHLSTRDVLPNTSTLTLATVPPGLQLTLGGQPLTAPQSVLGVVGVSRTLGAPSPQVLGGQSYEFDSWSDGGAATHGIDTPATDTTYTATYRAVASAGAAPVVWTALVNAVVSGSTLQQQGCCRGGAVSSQSIASGDGYVEFPIAELATGRTAGLSRGNSDTSAADIDFAVHLNGAGSAEVRENGVYKTDTPYASGNVFRVAVVGGQVRYSRNGVVFYTSARVPSYPLLVDVSLGGPGSTITNAVISGSGAAPDTTPPARSNGQPTGTLPAGTTTAAITLTTNESAACRYATAPGLGYDSMVAAFSASGGMSHSTTVTGLSDGSTYSYYPKCRDTAGNANTDDFPITFAVASSQDTTPPVIASVTATAVTATSATITWTTNEPADSQVEYGPTAAYGTATAPDPTLEMSHSEILTGLSPSTVYHYRVRSRDAAGNPALSGGFTFGTGAQPEGAQAVAWVALVNAVVSGSTLQQNGCCRGGAVSSQSIASGDGYVEFMIAELGTGRTAGLSRGNTDTSAADIDFAVHLNGAGNAEVRENGVYKADTPYASGNVFRVAVVGGQVRYSRNGVVFYTSARVPSYPLLVDVSLGSPGSTITNAVFSSGAP